MYRSVGCSVLLSQALQDMQYIGPLRERLAPFAVTGTGTYSEVGDTGSHVMRVLASQQRVALRGKGARKTAEKRLREWLCDRFRILSDIRLSEIRPDLELTALLADERRGFRNMNVAYMGFGVSQLVPLIVATVMLPPSGCLLVEQPEVHLHPAAQAELADLFLSNLDDGRQCIVETHSEHLVLRLRRRIAEGTVHPARVRLFYVEKPGGQTRIKPLDIDKNGMVPEWPKGFFDDGYGEAMRIAEARLRRGGG
jgi:predicted ATPase